MPAIRNELVYTIEEVAEASGISTQTLSLYEKKGLILSHRSSQNQRMYSEIELAKVKDIQKMIDEMGMSLSGICHHLANIPCWKIRREVSVDHTKCPVYFNRSKPCWAMNKKCLHHKTSCRDCQVYLESINISCRKDTICFEIDDMLMAIKS